MIELKGAADWALTVLVGKTNVLTTRVETGQNTVAPGTLVGNHKGGWCNQTVPLLTRTFDVCREGFFVVQNHAADRTLLALDFAPVGNFWLVETPLGRQAACKVLGANLGEVNGRKRDPNVRRLQEKSWVELVLGSA